MALGHAHYFYLCVRVCVRLLGVGELTAVDNIPASLYFFNTKRMD